MTPDPRIAAAAYFFNFFRICSSPASVQRRASSSNGVCVGVALFEAAIACTGVGIARPIGVAEIVRAWRRDKVLNPKALALSGNARRTTAKSRSFRNAIPLEVG